MKRLSIIACTVMLCALLTSCGGSRRLTTNKSFDENTLRIGKAVEASNDYKIIIDDKRVMSTYGRNKYERKQLKRLSLEKAKEKLLQEAVIEHDCAMIAEPNFKYETKGKHIISITVVGYPGRYNFNKDSK